MTALKLTQMLRSRNQTSIRDKAKLNPSLGAVCFILKSQCFAIMDTSIFQPEYSSRKYGIKSNPLFVRHTMGSFKSWQTSLGNNKQNYKPQQQTNAKSEFHTVHCYTAVPLRRADKSQTHFTQINIIYILSTQVRFNVHGHNTVIHLHNETFLQQTRTINQHSSIHWGALPSWTCTIRGVNLKKNKYNCRLRSSGE